MSRWLQTITRVVITVITYLHYTMHMLLFMSLANTEGEIFWRRVSKAGAYTRPLFGSTQVQFIGYVGCRNFPQSIRQRDTWRCDQNGLG
jgi:hypothetical protein